MTLPVAVQAILFDLMNGGEKDWIKEPMTHKPPYWDLGREAALAAAAEFALGTVGAGVGATTVNLGLGGSGHNEKAQYSERADDFENNMERLNRKFETARKSKQRFGFYSYQLGWSHIH